MFLGPRRVLATLSQLAIAAAILVMTGAGAASAQARIASGGFMDLATSKASRPRLSAADIQKMLPDRGEFTFPSPYNTTGIRLTNAADCGGQDCVSYVGYSYWNNINNHVGSDTMLIFLGLQRTKGGGGPTLFSYNKNNGQTQKLGPLFSADSPWSWESGEGWYFSATQPNTLYVHQATGTSLQRYDVSSHAMSTVFDVASRPDVFGSNRYIWQIHSSNDDRVHSATLRDASSYGDLGCLAYREDTQQYYYYPQKGIDYDECQIDKSGRYLLIKEKLSTSSNDVDNRIIDLQAGTEQQLLDSQGAGGHSDNGFATMLAADNTYPMPGAVRLWHLDRDIHGAGQGLLVYQTTDWGADVGHVSFSDARSDMAAEQQYACGANANRSDLPRANEIVCFKLDGSLDTLIVAPNMTDLNASGGGSDDYSKMPKGNLDVTGEYFIWTSNESSGRADAFIVHIPKGQLGGTPTPVPTTPPPPAPTPSPAPTPAPVDNTPTPSPVVNVPVPVSGSISWSMQVNVAASGNTLQKSGGCSGCPDAGAVSEQQISSGSLQFSVSDVAALRFVGLSTVHGIDASSITYALRLQGGVAEVRESGTYRSDVHFNAGDTFRIAVDGSGAVSYAKNGSVFYTSGSKASGSLVASVALFDDSATVTGIALTGVPSSAAAPSPTTPVPAPPVADVPVTPTPTPDAPVADAPAPAPTSPVAASPETGRSRQRWPSRVSR